MLYYGLHKKDKIWQGLKAHCSHTQIIILYFYEA
jgi:hypothetical protein